MDSNKDYILEYLDRKLSEFREQHSDKLKKTSLTINTFTRQTITRSETGYSNEKEIERIYRYAMEGDLIFFEGSVTRADMAKNRHNMETFVQKLFEDAYTELLQQEKSIVNSVYGAQDSKTAKKPSNLDDTCVFHVKLHEDFDHEAFEKFIRSLYED